MRKAFNVTEKDNDILEYLDKKDNASRYIINLIRKDMKQEAAPADEDYIIKIIEKVLASKNIINNSNSCGQTDIRPTTHSEEILSSVQNILKF